MSIYHVDWIPPMAVPLFEEQIMQSLTKVMEHSLDTPEAILSYIRKGALCAWGVYEEHSYTPTAIAVTNVIDYPKARVLFIYALAGEGMPLWFKSLHVVMKDYAQKANCDYIEFHTRRKAVRFLEAEGFERQSSIYREPCYGRPI